MNAFEALETPLSYKCIVAAVDSLYAVCISNCNISSKFLKYMSECIHLITVIYELRNFALTKAPPIKELDDTSFRQPVCQGLGANLIASLML